MANALIGKKTPPGGATKKTFKVFISLKAIIDIVFITLILIALI